ncbi:MAG: hypothetical protein LBP80_01535 [Treponema sp.]|nr:hypothetical protein [Treponema sp.]
MACANISGAYDVYNGFLPDMGIHPYTSNEMNYPTLKGGVLHPRFPIKDAKEHIPEIKGIVGERPVIRIFDRNYASLESIDYVEGEGTQYVIRLRQGEYKGEVGVPGGGESGEAAIKHTEKRLRGVKEEEPERAEELKRKGATRARVIRMAFKEGEGALITNIKGYTEEQIRGLYRERREGVLNQTSE